MNESFSEWAEVNQPFELKYQKCYNYRDFNTWDTQWSSIFNNFGLDKDYFNNKVLADIGCGSRPALSYFNKTNTKHCLEPLLDEFLEIEKHAKIKFPGKTNWAKRKDKPHSVVKNWFTEEPFILHSVPYETSVPELINNVDFILCWNVLDHGYDWRQGINNMIDYLKPGGLLLLGTDYEAHKYHLGIDNPSELEEIIKTNFNLKRACKHNEKVMWSRDYMVLAEKI